MPKVPKCPFCNKEILNKDEAIKHNNRYYHQECWEKLQAEKESKKSDYEKLINYLYELYDGNVPKFVFKQIKDYKNDYGMKYSGILLTLHYIYDILGMKFDETNGIGMVVYKYDECCKTWKHQKQVEKAINNFEFEDKKVVINKRYNSSKRQKYKEINMEEL